MINESRLDIYDYIKSLLVGVTKNIYSMFVPEELTNDDLTNGFIVIRLGEINDRSEFRGQAFASVRAFVQAYIPSKSRGRLDKTKYKAFETGISQAIETEIDNSANENEYFSIVSDGILSMDDKDDSTQDNPFFIYIKSFIVQIDN